MGLGLRLLAAVQAGLGFLGIIIPVPRVLLLPLFVAPVPSARRCVWLCCRRHRRRLGSHTHRRWRSCTRGRHRCRGRGRGGRGRGGQRDSGPDRGRQCRGSSRLSLCPFWQGLSAELLYTTKRRLFRLLGQRRLGSGRRGLRSSSCPGRRHSIAVVCRRGGLGSGSTGLARHFGWHGRRSGLWLRWRWSLLWQLHLGLHANGSPAGIVAPEHELARLIQGTAKDVCIGGAIQALCPGIEVREGLWVGPGHVRRCV